MSNLTDLYTFDVTWNSMGKPYTRSVDAAYFAESSSGAFIEFKTKGHAVVFSVRATNVLTIVRGSAIDPDAT